MDPDNHQIVLFLQKSPNWRFFAKNQQISPKIAKLQIFFLQNLKNLCYWEEEEKPSILRGRRKTFDTERKKKIKSYLHLYFENIQNPNECARAYMEPPYRWYWFFLPIPPTPQPITTIWLLGEKIILMIKDIYEPWFFKNPKESLKNREFKITLFLPHCLSFISKIVIF